MVIHNVGVASIWHYWTFTLIVVELWICRSFVAVGVDPAVMGIGPAVAIPAAVKAAGLEISDIDLFEVNEVHYFPIQLQNVACS